MLVCITHFEVDVHNRIKAVTARRLEIRFHVERDAITSGLQRRREQVAHAAILVGVRAPDNFTVRIRQRDRYVASGLPKGRVQYVCGDRAHDSRSLSKRDRVICRCSAAALAISILRSLRMRDSSSARICSGCLPLANTMKMK